MSTILYIYIILVMIINKQHIYKKDVWIKELTNTRTNTIILLSKKKKN